MAPHLAEVRKTVEDPDFCIRDNTDGYHNYRLGILPGRFRHMYLHVIVRRVKGRPSRVSTFWPCKVPDPGTIVCLTRKPPRT